MDVMFGKMVLTLVSGKIEMSLGAVVSKFLSVTNVCV